MTDRSKTFEITIAALGLIVTALLGYGQYKLNKEQSEIAIRQQEAEKIRAIDNIEVQIMSLVSTHLSNLSKPGAEFASSQRVVLAASEYLSSQHQRTALAAMAAKISEGNTTVPTDVTTRIKEATSIATPSANWFTVLASLPVDDEASAKEIANRFLENVESKYQSGQIQLYRTKISNSFAVVLNGPSNRTTAIEAASKARRVELAKDAFAQQDRDWTLIGTAPFSQ